MDFLSLILKFFLYLIIFTLIFLSLFLLKVYAGKSVGDPSYPPVQGTIFHQLFYHSRLYDHQTEVAKQHPTFRLLAVHQSEIYTTDPRNIEHMLKTHFDKYDKGEYHRGNLRDLFGYGIFLEDGDKWRQQRKLASYEFSTRVLRDFSCAVFRSSAVKLVRIVAHFARDKQAFDMHDILMKYGLESIFKVGFGVDLNCMDGSSSEEGAKFIEAFDDANETVTFRYMDPLWKLKRILNVGSEAALKKNIQTMDKFVRQLIQQKRQLSLENKPLMRKEDILSRFLEASEKDPEHMNDEYLKDIILNFLLAGKDTSANAISWFVYCLCTNPIVQEKIVQEVRHIMFNSDENDGTKFDIDNFVSRVTDDTMEKMHYLHAALSETLRLYPAVPVNGRCAMVDDVLPDGYKVKKGDNVYYLPYSMGRMQSIWGDDALEFRPERWLQNGVFRPESPFKFVAFHAGPRICLGRDFAYRQMKILAVALLYLFRFKLVDEKTAGGYRPMLTLHIKGGLPVYAIPRMNLSALNVF